MVIALLTDFGDFYPGVMKGVIRRLSSAEIIDITHSIEPQNIYEGAFLLYSSYRFFPENAVFIAVVDPGVGGERRAIAIKTENFWFVGPDNGLLYQSVKEDGIEEIYVIDGRISEIVGSLSSTFHGRDVFAPAGALLHEERLDEKYFQKTKEDIMHLDLFDYRIDEEKVLCRILHIDRFGNAVTNIRKDAVRRLGIRKIIYKGDVFPIVNRYEDVGVGDPLAIVGSFDTVELSIREGNFAKKYNAKCKEIEMRWSY